MTEPSVGNRRVRIGLLTLGALMWVAVFVVIYFKWKTYREITADPQEVEGTPVPVNATVFRPYELPEFAPLIDQNKQPVTKADLAGQPWLASFLFSRCTENCPRVAAELERLQKKLGDLPVRFVTITVDPENDTPEVMKRWADSLNADATRWKFLTGDPDDVYKLVREGFRITAVQRTGEDRTPGKEVSHSEALMLVDAKGVVIGKYLGSNEADLNRLRRDLRAADEKWRTEKAAQKSKAKTGSRDDG